MYKLYILFPDSTINLLIAYSYDLRNDFKIRDTKFETRAILDPPIEFLRYDDTAQNKIKKHNNLKIIRDIIITPFVIID